MIHNKHWIICMASGKSQKYKLWKLILKSFCFCSRNTKKRLFSTIIPPLSNKYVGTSKIYIINYLSALSTIRFFYKQRSLSTSASSFCLIFRFSIVLFSPIFSQIWPKIAYFFNFVQFFPKVLLTFFQSELALFKC